MSNLLASIQYWRTLGLTWAESGERAVETWGQASAADLPGTLLLAQQIEAAGLAMEGEFSNLPWAQVNVPVSPGQESAWLYRTIVPVFDPNTGQTEEILTLVRSNKPLDPASVREAAKRAIRQNIVGSPRGFTAPSGEQFQVSSAPSQQPVIIGVSRNG